jgi:hypothetical protein
VNNVDGHGSATDSTSLLREPSPLEDFARGSSDFYPFQPGGIKNEKSHIVEERIVKYDNCELEILGIYYLGFQKKILL